MIFFGIVELSLFDHRNRRSAMNATGPPTTLTGTNDVRSCKACFATDDTRDA